MHKASPGKGEEYIMPNTGGFDVMLQFKQDIINDILVRVLQELRSRLKRPPALFSLMS
jgi:hypothetical protein